MTPNRLTYSHLRRRFEALGYPFYDTGDYNLNIVGIRTPDMRSNLFNDWIVVAFRQFDHELLFVFDATTDPGLYWRQHPINVAGTAILKPGHHKGMFRIGQHKGRYTALVQHASVPVYRDNDGNAVLDAYRGIPVEIGQYGINLHRASNEYSEGDEVGKWSAGCQVIARSSDFDLFMAICHRAAREWGPIFSYTLLEEGELWGV